MSKHDFFHSTPSDIDIFLNGIDRKQKSDAKKIEYIAWLHGFYVKLAIQEGLHGSNKAQYPRQPIGEEPRQDTNSGLIVATEEMSEEDKERTRKLFLDNLLEMQKNFEGKR